MLIMEPRPYGRALTRKNALEMRNNDSEEEKSGESCTIVSAKRSPCYVPVLTYVYNNNSKLGV